MDPLTRRQRLSCGLVALVLLPLAFLVSPPDAPPLYNGLGFPDDPYRAFGTSSSSPPGSAAARVDSSRGTSEAAYVGTPERPPQAALVLPAGALTDDSGPVSVSLEPVELPEATADGVVLSNAYRVAATGLRTREFVPDAKVIVQLRVPDVVEERVAIEFHDGRRWTVLPTRRTGEHVYSAFLPSFGTVAAVLIRNSRLSVEHGAPAGRRTEGYVVLAAGAAALLAAVGLLRARRRPVLGRRHDEYGEDRLDQP